MDSNVVNDQNRMVSKRTERMATSIGCKMSDGRFFLYLVLFSFVSWALDLHFYSNRAPQLQNSILIMQCA